MAYSIQDLGPSRLMSALACIVLSSTAVAGPSGQWVGGGDLCPSSRTAPICAYDPDTERLFVLVGHDFSELAKTDAWALDLRGVPRWNPIAIGGPQPGIGGTHVFDPVRGRVIAFGGRRDIHDYNSETWSHALGNAVAWSQETTSPPPSARSGASGVYDSARDRMIVFGGRTGFSSWVGDVHALDFGTNVWQPITPSGTPPDARSEHAAIYDPVGDRMILFGGQNGSGALGDVWQLEFSPTPHWSLLDVLPSPHPSARAGAAVIHDPVRNRMIVVGGTSGQSETWALNLVSLVWAQLAVAPARSGAGAVYDPEMDRLVMFGGQQGPHLRYDAWELALWTPSPWKVLHVGKPGPRHGHTAIYVPTRDEVVLFGGNGSTSFGDASAYNDVIVYPLDDPNWLALATTGTAPWPGSGHSAIYDPGQNRMIVYGGGNGAGASDLRSLSLGITPTWTRLTATGALPGPRMNHTAIHDPIRNRMILYGGNGTDTRVFALALDGPPVWEQIVGQTAGIEPRVGHSAVYDPLRDRMIVFGGGDHPQLWALSLGAVPTWTSLSALGDPPIENSYSTEIYDPEWDRILFFGGTFQSPSNAVFELSFLGGTPTWTQLSPTGPGLTHRSHAAGAYDPGRNAFFVHGGYFSFSSSSYSVDGHRLLTWTDFVSAPESALPSALAIRQVRPNPGRGLQTFELELPLPVASGRLEVFTVTGQRVWSRTTGPLVAGRHAIAWEGRTSDDRLAAPGVYLARLSAGTATRSLRFVRVP
jgi:hypothetical protein